MCDKLAWQWWCHCRGDFIGRADHWPGQHDCQSDCGAAGTAGQEEPYCRSNHPPTSLRALQGGFWDKLTKGEWETETSFKRIHSPLCAHVHRYTVTVFGCCNCSSHPYLPWRDTFCMLMEVMGDKSYSSPKKKMQVQLKLQFESDQEALLDVRCFVTEPQCRNRNREFVVK